MTGNWAGAIFGVGRQHRDIAKRAPTMTDYGSEVSRRSIHTAGTLTLVTCSTESPRAPRNRPSCSRLVSTPAGATYFLVSQLRLARGARVLDVCTGTGLVGIQIAERLGCRVVGVDLSERMVEGASKSFWGSPEGDSPPLAEGLSDDAPLIETLRYVPPGRTIGGGCAPRNKNLRGWAGGSKAPAFLRQAPSAAERPGGPTGPLYPGPSSDEAALVRQPCRRKGTG